VTRPLDEAIASLLECPKTMTNGPCGGVALDGGCEVNPTEQCVWLDTSRSTAVDLLLTRNGIPDWSQEGDWSSAFTARPASIASDTFDRDVRPIRSDGSFEGLLRDGRFVVTAEINPPDSADASEMLSRIAPLIGVVDAVHISDNSLASPHMCGLALASMIERAGLETILHMTSRDRNRLMLQADMLGAAALGINNILCITGDHPSIGDHPQAKAVFDVDSVSMLEMFRHARDTSSLLSGRALESAPKIFLGGGGEPSSPPFDLRPERLAKKVAAGADFIVTQVVYDMDLFDAWMTRVRDLGLDKKVYILVSVGALGGPAMARGMNANTPGVVVPEALIQRLEASPVGKRRDTGLQICVEQIQRLREIPGVSGIDIMDVDPSRYIEIIESAGLTGGVLAAR
jgi:methylenetetrahydrofolate reductase (NADPH)